MKQSEPFFDHEKKQKNKKKKQKKQKKNLEIIGGFACR